MNFIIIHQIISMLTVWQITNLPTKKWKKWNVACVIRIKNYITMRPKSIRNSHVTHWYDYRDKYHRNNVYEIITININDVGLVGFSQNGGGGCGFWCWCCCHRLRRCCQHSNFVLHQPIHPSTKPLQQCQIFGSHLQMVKYSKNF